MNIQEKMPKVREYAGEDVHPPTPPNQQLLFEPNVSINGLIETGTVPFFLDRLAAIRESGADMIMELNTAGMPTARGVSLLR